MLLLVEDNSRLRPLLLELLRNAGYKADAVETMSDFLSVSQAGAYDLLIVDLMLPDGDGLEAIRTLRVRGCAAPVLVITAKGKIDDKINGLDNGADDYLIKPFNHEELLARVRALLRRPQNIVGPVLRVGNLEFNDATAEVRCGGKLVPLRPAERRLLMLLMRRSGNAMSKISIAEALSQSDRDFSRNALEANVHRIRKALEGLNSEVLIETIRRWGYRLRPLGVGATSGSVPSADLES